MPAFCKFYGFTPDQYRDLTLDELTRLGEFMERSTRDN